MAKQIGLFALNTALTELMAMDEKVVCVGEDIGKKGGTWLYFTGLFDKYGRDRVLQTPICEYGYTGFANGMAYGGFRPVVEFMYADFSALAYDAIVNMAAKARFNSNGGLSLPVTYILPQGGGGQSGSQHSQNVESWFANVPGLKIVCPTGPADMRRFIKASVMDDDPVLYIFSRACAMSVQEEIDPDEQEILSLNNAAKVVKEGADLTLVAWHRPLLYAQELVEELEQATGKTIEIIDPRVLCPLDTDAIYKSVRKTGRLLVCHEAPERGGFGQVISSLVSENCFDALKAPVARVGGYNTCIPFGSVEEYAYPQKDDIKEAALALLKG